MPDESQHSDKTPPSLKRKYDDKSTAAAADDSNLAGDIEIATQKAQEVTARLSSSAPSTTTLHPSKRSKTDVKAQYPKATISSSMVSYGHQGASKKIDIPKRRVRAVIGKGGEVIKYIQLQSGAKIQITRDSDADPNSTTRMVELMGAPDAIAAAEKLINEVLAVAEAGGSGVATLRLAAQAGCDEHVLKIPNRRVGLVIGKGGETIRNMQASSGARIKVIPLHLPPGDTSTERTLKIKGTPTQIESAKQLVCQVISGENPFRILAMSGGYSQQGDQARPPNNWAPPGAPAQQPSYGYAQPGAYSGPSFQYNMLQQQYAGYLPQPAGGYSTGWDQSTAPSLQQSTQGAEYDYYSQQPPQQPQSLGGAVAPGDGAAYNYSQPPGSGYRQPGQGYDQVSYGGYHAPPRSWYGQSPSYDQQQGYGSAPSYGNGNNSAQEGHAPNYVSRANSTQQGYASGLHPSPDYPPPGTARPSYAVPSTSQASYGSQPHMPSGYGPPQFQNPGATPPVYGQSQSPKTVAAGYGQSGYPPSQPPPFGYGSAYGPTSYGVAPGGQTGYGQAPPSYGNSYGTGYAQPPAYGSDGNAGSRGIYDGAPTQSPQHGTVAKTSPPQS